MNSRDEERVLCVCEDCGKRFYKGDNERFCLRCEYASRPDEQ